MAASFRPAGAEPKPQEARPASEAVAKAEAKEAKKEHTPRGDEVGLPRRPFALDVFAYADCGGRRRVLAYLTVRSSVSRLPSHDLPLSPGISPWRSSSADARMTTTATCWNCPA